MNFQPKEHAPCSKKMNFFGPEPKVCIHFEKILSRQSCRSARHDVPWHDDGIAGLRLLLRDLLQARGTFCLMLE
jgi:hypothetical protein